MSVAIEPGCGDAGSFRPVNLAPRSPQKQEKPEGLYVCRALVPASSFGLHRQLSLERGQDNLGRSLDR